MKCTESYFGWLSIAAAVVLLFGQFGFCQSPGNPTNQLPDDPEKAWSEVEKVHQRLRAPSSWRTQAPTPTQISEFQQQVQRDGMAYAEMAKEFIRRFPTNQNTGDARITVVYALMHAAGAGEPTSEKALEQFVSATSADTSLPIDDRVGVFLMAGNMAVLKPAGMRFFVEGQSKFRQEMDHAGKGRLREAMKRFPESEMPYQFMMALAERSSPEEQKLIATELLASPAPESVKALAKHFQEGTRPYQVGQPVDFKFTALDGREVDVQKMKGKVVIIDFWSTTCGPCLAEMPMLKSIYDRFHSQGLEIIGISLDDKETKLRHYLEEKEISWPQFFDGKGWGNKFAVRYGIFGIPTVWLLDRNGVLHTDRARGQLEKMVERLLASPGK